MGIRGARGETGSLWTATKGIIVFERMYVVKFPPAAYHVDRLMARCSVINGDFVTGQSLNLGEGGHFH
jgi:hypothetical protein